MRIIIARDDASIARNIENEKSRFNSYAGTATAELADRLGKARVEHNWVSPAIIASHVLTGNDAALKQVSQIVGQQAFKYGVSPSDNRPGVVSAQERTANNQRVLAKAKAATVDRPMVAPTSRTTPPKKSGGPGWWGHLPAYSFAATVGDFMTPEAVENVVGKVTYGGYSLLKSGVAGFTAGTMFIPQVIQNEIAAAANYGTIGDSWKQQRNGSLLNQFIAGPLIQETSLGQIFNQTIQGILSDKKVTAKDILGSGFSPSGLVAQKQAEAARAFRPTTGTGEETSAFTLGRFGAQSIADTGIIQEGSVPYNLISGAIDFATALKTDPTLGKPIKQPFGSAGKAATAIPEGKAIEAVSSLAKTAVETPKINPSLLNKTENVLFHGTANPLAEGNFSSIFDIYQPDAKNLMGRGIYLTDSGEVAASYTAKGTNKNIQKVGDIKLSSSGIVYKTELSPTARIIDLRQPNQEINNAILKTVNNDWFINLIEDANNSVDDILSVINDPSSTGEQAMAAFKRSLKGVILEGADEASASLTEEMSTFADGISYQGGVRRGGLGKHNAFVIFNPDAVKITENINPLMDILESQSATNGIRSAAGLVEGGRPTVNPTLWNEFKTTPKAVEVFKPFVEEKNPAQVWRNMKRQGLMSADEIAGASNHTELIQAFDNAVNNLDPAYNIRNVPSGKFESVSDFGYKIKQSSQRFTNVFEVLPESTYIPNSDPQVAATRLDDLMGYLKFPMDQRDKWVNRLIQTHKDGTSKSFFEFLSDWESTVLAPALKKNLVPKSEIPRLTRWRQQTIDQVTRFTLQDIQDGINPAWMEAGGYGPLRNTQLLQDGAYIVDPTMLDEVAKKLGKLYKIEQQAAKLPGAVRVPVKAAFSSGEKLSDAYGWYQSNLWKPVVVMAGRYLTRVLPEEQLRVLLNGTFEHPGHYIGAIFDGRFAAKLGKDGMYVADVFGDPINKAKLAVEVDNKLIQFRQVETEVAALRNAGKIADADKLASLYADELAAIPDLIVQQERTMQILNDSTATLNDALIGAVPGKAKQQLFNLYQDGSYVKTGNLNIVSKNIGKERKLWVDGVVQEVADLYNNPHIRRIAKADLFDNDVLTINGIESTWAEHLKAGRFLNSDEAIATWLHDGSGRQYFEKYFKNFANIAEGYNWDTMANAREFVRVLNNEVTSIAGTNETILKAITTGAFEGETAFSRNVHNLIDGKESFTNYVANEFVNDLSSPSHIRYRSQSTVASSGPGSKAAAGWDYIISLFFQGAYGMSSDKLSRSPAFRAGYWGRVEEVVSVASPEAAAKLLKNLDSANLPRPQADRIRRLLKLSNGTNDLEAVDATARGFGLQYERNLLFDASKKSAFGAHHKYLFPFFEAYREQGSTWLKLVAERPENIHKIDIALRALREADGIGLGDQNGDGKKDGFLYRDKQTGEERVAVAGSGWLGTLFSGVPFGNFSLPTGSMTMFNGILPGFGPAVQFPLQYFIPTTKNWQGLNDILFPYGRPEETGVSPAGGFAKLEFPRPTWLKRVTPYLSDEAKKIPFTGNFVGDVIQLIGGDPKETEVWQAYNLRTLQSLSSTRGIPTTSKEMESLLADAETKTNQLYFLRGIGNFILPGTPVSKFMAETKLGSIELGVLADTRRLFEEQAIAAGQTSADGDARFIDVYGDTVWATFSSLRRSDKYEGVVMSKEFEDWFDGNQKLINTYPQVASYFGPQKQPGKFGPQEQSVYNRFIAKGVIKTQTGEQLIAQAQSNVAYTFLDSIQSKMTPAQQASPTGQAILTSTKEILKKSFPKWDVALAGAESKSKRENQIKQLREIVIDPKVKDTDMGQTVAAYMAYRDGEVAKLLKQGVKGWQTSAKGLPMRQQLRTIGEGFSKVVPEFASLWDRVLSKEFTIPTEEGQ